MHLDFAELNELLHIDLCGADPSVHGITADDLVLRLQFDIRHALPGCVDKLNVVARHENAADDFSAEFTDHARSISRHFATR